VRMFRVSACLAMALTVLTAIAPLAKAGASSNSAYPVTIDSCGIKTTYTKAPTRAVIIDANMDTYMMALGLAKHMIGTFGVEPDGPLAPQFQKEEATVKSYGDNYPSNLESLIGLKPDFVFAGYNYGYVQGTTLSPQGLAKFGIHAYVLAESCAHVQASIKAPSVDTVYTDLTNLGKIFDVRAKAAQVISQMKSQIALAEAKVKGTKPVSVMVFIGVRQGAPRIAAGLTVPSALLTIAGGTNIFSSLLVTYTNLSWEQVIAAAPQCIIINAGPGNPASATENVFRTTADLENVPAVKNNCFLPLHNDQITPDSQSGATALQIAKWLHPKAFGLKADGS
jgi:iron complex transport system substrate-binding protein